jgi:hypothetical protein
MERVEVVGDQEGWKKMRRQEGGKGKEEKREEREGQEEM